MLVARLQIVRALNSWCHLTTSCYPEEQILQTKAVYKKVHHNRKKEPSWLGWLPNDSSLFKSQKKEKVSVQTSEGKALL